MIQVRRVFEWCRMAKYHGTTGYRSSDYGCMFQNVGFVLLDNRQQRVIESATICLSHIIESGACGVSKVDINVCLDSFLQCPARACLSPGEDIALGQNSVRPCLLNTRHNSSSQVEWSI